MNEATKLNVYPRGMSVKYGLVVPVIEPPVIGFAARREYGVNSV